MASFAASVTVEDLERDPYAIYARLREQEPVAFVPAVNAWFVTRWDDVGVITKNPDLFSSEDPTSPVCRHFGMPAIIHTDGDVHKRLRQGFAPHYSARNVATYIDELVTPIAGHFLERLLEKGRAELMAEYFEPISALCLARSIGLQDVDVTTLRQWFAGLSQGAIDFERDPQRGAVCARTVSEINQALAPVFERLAATADDSVLSNMLRYGLPEGEVCSREFIMPTVLVALLGGMQEPGHGAGTTLVGLLSDQAQMQYVLEDLDGRLRNAVLEGVRWVSPIGTQGRMPLRDIEVGGVGLKKGASVSAILASANRDPTMFERPDEFDVRRPEAGGGHATFGFGPHFCAGKWFALAQMEISLRVLIRGVENLRLDPGARIPEFQGWEFRAPKRLDVLFDS